MQCGLCTGFLTEKRLEKDGRRIKNVIFDVGNVLVDYDWKTYLKGFHFPEEEEKKLAKEIFQSDIWNERDKGLYDEEEYISPVYRKRLLNTKKEYPQSSERNT